MAGTAEQQRVTEALLTEIEATQFPSQMQLDRVERLISTRDELETYIAVLTEKLDGKMFPGRQLLDRLERLMRVLKRFDQEEAGDEGR